MSANFYDAIVLGTDLGPLTAGALLAKRGFRVLVVGGSAPSQQYTCYDYTFSRRPFMMVPSQSPVMWRIQNELGISQLVKQIAYNPEPVCQVILRRARPDIFKDTSLTKAELRREFPNDIDFIDATFDSLGRVNGEIDKLFANDLVLPPETFIEKREFVRSEVQNPFRPGTPTEILDRDRLSPQFVAFLEAPVRFATAGFSPVPPLVKYRQMGGWLCDGLAIRGGQDGYANLLLDQISACGGDHQLGRVVQELRVRKGRVYGVRMAGRDETVGCRVILTDLSPTELKQCVSPSHWTKRFRALVEQEREVTLGYAVNLGLDKEVVPRGLAGTSFVSFGPGLQDELIRIEQVTQVKERSAALQISCIVPPQHKGTIYSGELRDALLDRVRSIIPFLDNYLRVIHSPYDGLGAIDLTGKAKGVAPPAQHTEEIPKWRLTHPSGNGALGPENFHHRTGIKGLVLAGNQVISGLGMEGEMLAAWGAARVAGKTDKRRERLVRSMRAKVEM